MVQQSVGLKRLVVQAVVGAIRDGLHSQPAAAKSLLDEHALAALQSPLALSLLLLALPAAAPPTQAAFFSAAVKLFLSAPG